ncbi:hypothetical protein BDDG_12686 [Blastomyces dermatitidis ATCC 18188]|uniref:Uncharacterized protein n=1 Tax=Ajellomyces dermatitidis (strain ATCC 18188 / CBS 674.68) TaxID=653446 RepID=A0A0J9EQC5_AJEDA|nr:hypothetical protein BDDG_12686 [Blastomyces dermatitidis ATCC 18188]
MIRSNAFRQYNNSTQSTWYKRLEHSSKNIIIKLANDATGIQITYLEAAADELITELCNLYQLSNAENQISRDFHVRSYTLYSTPESTPGSAGSNVNTGSNVDTGLNIDINTQSAAIANCTQNTDVDINTYSAAIDNHTQNITSRAHDISANFDEDNIIEGRRTRNHRAAHFVTVENVKVNSFQIINEAFSHSHSHSDFYKSQNLFSNTVFTVINNTSISTASIPSRIHRSQLPDSLNY